ncbi:MAG: hypothetical protein WC340_15025 [Kiritimatiellia bacterium]
MTAPPEVTALGYSASQAAITYHPSPGPYLSIPIPTPTPIG